METFWNHIHLSTPVILSLPVQGSNPYEIVARFKNIANDIKSVMKDLKVLNTEGATLSRLIYKFKHKLRQDKGFKDLQKINRCLTNYLTMHLPFTLKSIRESLHENCGPSRQMVEWALVRLYGCAHLFHRVVLLCVDAAGHFMVKIKLNHNWDSTFFTIAIISRIWTLAQFLVRSCCQWYMDFFSFLNNLESASTWLPHGIVLPSDLASTLDNADYLNLNQLSKPVDIVKQVGAQASQQTKTQLISVIDNNMFDDLGQAVPRRYFKENIRETQYNQKPLLNGNDNNINKNKKKDSAYDVPLKPTDSINKLTDDMDVGVPISRIEENGDSPCVQNKDSKQKKKNSKEKPVKKSFYSVDNIETSQDLLKFYKHECSARNNFSDNSKHKCVLKVADKLQWSMMEKFIKKHITIIKRFEDEGLISKKNKTLEKVRANIRIWSSE